MPQESVLDYLQELLEQLEGAQGQADPEARQKLELLRAQLQLLDAAQQGQGGEGGSQGPAAAALHSEVAVAQELDSLDMQLTTLEQRLDGLDDGARQLVQQTVAGWVGVVVAEELEEEGGATKGGGIQAGPPK